VWNDSQIKVRIPTRAGTGSIKVATNDSGSFTTINSFTIKFAHLNIGYKSSAQDSAYYTTDLKNDNNKGGYTFQLNPRFKANSDRVNSFLRSMETWRCGTLVNWDVGRDTNIKVINGDQVNIVKLTKFTDSKLAVCYSYWNGCFISGTNMEWYVNELDIEADSTINWYYLTGTIGGSQYDFQSVLSHELGHGHQLGHVISTNELMNYSISNGKKKSTLSTADLSGGKYVMDISVKTNVCNNGGAMKALAQSACGYTKPLSGFKADKTSICPANTSVFTDTTIGIVKSYVWNFGTGATPATANTKGPHTVTYNTEGSRTVKLFATNDFGTDSTVKSNYITVMPGKPATPKNLVYDDSACLGIDIWKVDTFSGTSSLIWQLPAQATGTSSTKNTRTLLWTAAGGPYTFWVKATNSCGSSDSLVGKSIVLNNPTCSFTKVENGRTVTFTNTSQFATLYKWYFGDGDSSALLNPVHIYPMGKAYSATLKSINKCKTASLTLTVNPFHPGNINKIEKANNLAFPNPTHDILYLLKEVVSYTLMDATGQIISKGKELELDLTSRAKGIYILNTYTYSGDSFFIKIVKD
ncbi:MAG: PKD domain-containing protein, partial [Bacteroidia bacterium]